VVSSVNMNFWQVLTLHNVSSPIDTSSRRHTRPGHDVHLLPADPPGIISDHSLVRCHLPIVADPAPSTARLVRAWRQVDRDTLRRVLEESALCQPIPPDTNVDILFDTYDKLLCDVAGRLAPLHTVQLTSYRPPCSVVRRRLS